MATSAVDDEKPGPRRTTHSWTGLAVVVSCVLATLGVLAFTALVVGRLFFFEPCLSPSNAMAPTILGRHWTAACPRCGAPAYCSPLDELDPEYESPLMICGAEFHVSHITVLDRTTHQPDRFVIAKSVAPRRWDLVAFQFPEEPSTRYLMRLIGMPGETVFLDEGAVWINGQRIGCPASLHGLTYESELNDVPVELWGTRQRPAQLGPDAYFVLGDFSQRAKDSRLWQRGAPGHPPYAVPGSQSRIHLQSRWFEEGP